MAKYAHWRVSFEKMSDGAIHARTCALVSTMASHVSSHTLPASSARYQSALEALSRVGIGILSGLFKTTSGDLAFPVITLRPLTSCVRTIGHHHLSSRRLERGSHSVFISKIHVTDGYLVGEGRTKRICEIKRR